MDIKIGKLSDKDLNGVRSPKHFPRNSFLRFKDLNFNQNKSNKDLLSVSPPVRPFDSKLLHVPDVFATYKNFRKSFFKK